jgi:hypothetical protein
MIFDLLAIVPYHLMDFDTEGGGQRAQTLRFLRLCRLSRFVQAASGIIEFFEKMCFNYARWVQKKTVSNVSSVIW